MKGSGVGFEVNPNLCDVSGKVWLGVVYENDTCMDKVWTRYGQQHTYQPLGGQILFPSPHSWYQCSYYKVVSSLSRSGDGWCVPCKRICDPSPNCAPPTLMMTLNPAVPMMVENTTTPRGAMRAWVGTAQHSTARRSTAQRGKYAAEHTMQRNTQQSVRRNGAESLGPGRGQNTRGGRRGRCTVCSTSTAYGTG